MKQSLQGEYLISLSVSPINYDNCRSIISEWVKECCRPSKIIVQANVNSIVNAKECKYYRACVLQSDLVVADGMPIVWLLRGQGHKIVNRVYGPELMILLAKEAAKNGWRCYLFGGKPGVPEELEKKLGKIAPGINIVGTYSPPFHQLTNDEDHRICAMISATKPDIVWVGLGSPKQDIWMYEHRQKIQASVLHGVGAAFDFLTDRVRQAPRWMMRLGFEWLFRLSQEPKRLGQRYTINNLKFIYYLVGDLGRRKKNSKSSTGSR